MDILSYLIGKQTGGGAIPSGYIKPTGTIDITENGEYDVAQYASANIDVSGGGDSSAEIAIIERTISGEYTNSEATAIGAYAFTQCGRLTKVEFPNATQIGSSAFMSCYSLVTASFPNVKDIWTQAFGSCRSLLTVNFPNATNIRTEAFRNCAALTTANLPNVTSVSNGIFSGCGALQTVYMPKLISVADGVFSRCNVLESASFPNATNIGSSAFASCFALASLYLLGSTIATLKNINAFVFTPMSLSTYLGHFGSIYVQESLLGGWQAASNWSVYSERFVGLTDEEIAELDGQ